MPQEATTLEPEETRLLLSILCAHPVKILCWSAACALDTLLLSRCPALRGKLLGYVYRSIMGRMPVHAQAAREPGPADTARAAKLNVASNPN